MRKQEYDLIIKEAQLGSVKAFEELVYMHAELIYNLNMQLSKNEVEAQDMTQEVFKRAFHKIDSYKADSKFSTWLYKIANNLWIDKCRRKKLIDFLSLSLIRDKNGPHLVDDYPCPEEITESKELAVIIQRGLQTLSQKERIVVVLSLFYEKSYKQIADICSCTTGTVGSRLFRGLAKLRTYLLKELQTDEL